MKIEETPLKDLFIITPVVLKDERGFFMEVFHHKKFKELGLDLSFVQDNQSRSQKNVIRGLHFQWNKPLGKLIRVSQGRAFMVVVDIRKDSDTFGKWFGLELDDKEHKMIYAPPGFATGFYAREEITDIVYKYTAFYNKEGESNIVWNDPQIGIKWPIDKPLLSERDKNAQTLNMWSSRAESTIF